MLVRSEQWEVRQETLESLGIHDGGPRVMTYFKISLLARNWDSAIFFGGGAETRNSLFVVHIGLCKLSHIIRLSEINYIKLSAMSHF